MKFCVTDRVMMVRNSLLRPPRRLAASRLIIAILLLIPGSSILASAQTPAPGAKLTLVIVEGDSGINNIKRRATREVIVQVEDENHRPVGGASLSAFLPSDGASGTFVDGGRMFNGTSGNDGRFRFSFRPNKVQGKFQIQLSGSFQGQALAGAVAQTNTLGIAVAAAGLSLTAKILGPGPVVIGPGH